MKGGGAVADAVFFDRLRADPSSNQHVVDVEQVCDAYLQWAKRPIKGSVDKGRNGPYDIPVDTLILKLTDVRVPVLTVNTPIDPALHYHNSISITHSDRTFNTP